MAAPACANRTHGSGHPEIAGHASARITQEGIVMNAAAEAIAERPATPPAAGSDIVVQARGLTKRYKNAVALDGADFQVGNGRIVGLIGPNGAGKTTALKAILGLTDFEGDLKVLGMDPRKQRPQLMREVCFIADVATLPRWIRVHEAIRSEERRV